MIYRLGNEAKDFDENRQVKISFQDQSQVEHPSSHPSWIKTTVYRIFCEISIVKPFLSSKALEESSFLHVKRCL